MLSRIDYKICDLFSNTKKLCRKITRKTKQETSAADVR